MSKVYKISIVGNGTSAVNAIDALLNEIENLNPALIPPIEITVYGLGPESDCGKGFAYGIAGDDGNMTQSAREGRADYGSKKGDFCRYAAQQLKRPANDIERRSVVGGFHNHRHYENKKRGEGLNVRIAYSQAEVIDVTQDTAASGYQIITRDGVAGNADRVVLAVGDILSSRFDEAIEQFPDQVFSSPYVAFDEILKGNSEESHVVAFGTRSTFLDLVNQLFDRGYKGKVTGISSTGQTSWQSKEHHIPYLPQHLRSDGTLGTTKDVLRALLLELSEAEHKGAYVPHSLRPKLFNAVRSDAEPYRLRWQFDLKEEAERAAGLTYHEVIQGVNWEKIYEGLRSKKEQEVFLTTLGDFIIYNRVNCVVPADFRKFCGHVEAGRVKIEQNTFTTFDIHSRFNDAALEISLQGEQSIICHQIVNCAIGPASSRAQAREMDLLGNLVGKGWLVPLEGTGFSVSGRHNIDLLGVQGRPYPFSSIGLETNGRQIAYWVKEISQDIVSRTAGVAVKLFRPAQRVAAHG